METPKYKPALAVQILLDHSGSMGAIRNQTISAVNEFVRQLGYAVAPVSVSLTLFGYDLEGTVFDNIPIDQVPKLTQRNYAPNSGTNVAFSVVRVIGTRMDPLDAFQKVLVIVTDGLDNSPSRESARDMIRQRLKDGWLVLFLGATHNQNDPDLNREYRKAMLGYAKALGVPPGTTLAFDASNIEPIMAAAANAALRFSGTGDAKLATFTDEEKAKA